MKKSILLEMINEEIDNVKYGIDNFLIRRGLSLPLGVSITGWCEK